MQTLIDYLKALPAGGANAFAERCGVTFRHLQNITYGDRMASAALALAIERESGGAVSRQELRPDDWRDYWPDLPPPETGKRTKRTTKTA